MKQPLMKIWKVFSFVVWWLLHEWLFDLGYFVGRILVVLVSKPKVYGRENIPREGGVIITCNHLSQWDLVFMHNLLERPAFYMTKKEFLDIIFIGGLVRLLGAFPVNRGKYDREALQFSIKLLKDGKQLIIFPEGTRSKTFTLAEGHSGAALIALQADALIVPVAISGSEKISRKKEYGPNGKKIKPEVVVRVGQPYHLPQPEKGKKQNLEELGDLMMTRIAEMLPAEYQGAYSPEKLAERKAQRERELAEQQNQRAAKRAARKQSQGVEVETEETV
ncbi:MAG TPA: lysophospholipid acyltransferase family protein [Chloroflexia bacterium]|nr:lysophospholipid acyltransferase family protein [Chloroflexia bacterium]